MIRRVPGMGLAAVAFALLVPSVVYGHAERPMEYPDPSAGSVPEYRTSGPKLVVCKADSERRVKRIFKGRAERQRLRLLDQCEFRNVQAAVDRARNGHRIMIMPGRYKEKPSRRVPTPDPRCEEMFGPPLMTGTSLGSATPGNAFGEGVATGEVPTYQHHRICPNSYNLVMIAGDGPDRNRTCEGRREKCNLQIEGMGKRPTDVRFVGTRKKFNIFRADRADGIGFYNFHAKYSDFNNLYVAETNGFRFEDIVSRYSFEYGFLSFVSDNGLYKDLEASHSGDSGIYPGSGPQRERCGDYGIEVDNVDSHHNLLGYSATAGDSVDVHDSDFHDNVVGISNDSFIGGHPGLPQDCSRFAGNRIYSNNFNLFNDKRDEICVQPSMEQPRRSVCPTFAAPLGTGILIAGGNGNLIEDNEIYDNWRYGTMLFHVPGAVRGDLEPQFQVDTSHDNVFRRNAMGTGPGGAKLPNGTDFWWDEQGSGNCWSANRGSRGGQPSSDPPRPLLPGCPDLIPYPGRPATSKTSAQAPCATFDQRENREPVGCSWVVKPDRPG